MYCKYCGKAISDGSRVCAYCGENIAPAPTKQEEDYQPEPQKKNSSISTVVIFLVGLVIALILTIVVIVMVSQSSGEPNAEKPGKNPTAGAAEEQTEADIGLPADNAYFDVFKQYESYVLQGSNNTYKCYSDIANMTDEELTIAEQEIHARHGKKFSDPDLKAYFEARTWYTPASGSYTPNDYEQANLDLIQIYRDKQDGSLYRSGNVYLNAFAKNTDYAIPSSGSRTLDSYDLDYLTLNQLCVARNEILARHGWIFDDRQLREYFYSKEWYRPSVPGKQFNYAVLNSAEQTNISLIQVYEKRAEGVSWSYDNPYKSVYYTYSYQDYIFYNSSSRYLTQYDLAGMTEDELCIARNEIYARNGYTFKSTNLTEYFLHHDWYFPSAAPGETPYFNDIENANIDLIAYAEEKAAQMGDVFIPDDYISDTYW